MNIQKLDMSTLQPAVGITTSPRSLRNRSCSKNSLVTIDVALRLVELPLSFLDLRIVMVHFVMVNCLSTSVTTAESETGEDPQLYNKMEQI